MKFKKIIASTFLLALLSGCSVNGHDAGENNLKPSHASYIPTEVVVGSESAKSYFLFEIKSDVLPDKKFVIYSDDFRKKKSFSLCPETPKYNCESYIQVLERSNVARRAFCNAAPKKLKQKTALRRPMFILCIVDIK
ncbi:hypothetical protein [Idiomarina aminovorans]|uniref:hypothetical protein n=1 Tax=Idiomarina aminovorans TaxID=2914829 RepID=UPI0020048F9A|nr:hypothetical protein [Idiomarina sp. ATCH4]